MNKTSVFFVSALGIATSFNGAIAAEVNAPVNCACESAALSSVGSLGTITAAEGSVYYTGRSGYEKAMPGAKLVLG